MNKFAIGTPILKQDDEKFLESNGIKTVLDLRNSCDLNKTNRETYINSLPDFKYINIPLPDHRTPRLATTSEIRKAVDELNISISKGAVFMHCHAAMERSPLISIAFLHLKKGFTIVQSCDYVKQQNISTIVNTNQLKYIK